MIFGLHTTFRTWRLLLPVVLLLTLFSCKQDTTLVPADLQGRSYFPLHQGSWISYDADSIVHLDDDDIYLLDTSIQAFHFQIRENVDSSFVDGEGDTVFRITRYKRNDTASAWVFMDVWTAQTNAVNAQRVEDNLRFVKLVYPFSDRKVWNGNAYNYYPEEAYRYDLIHQPLSLGAFHFDSTCTVIQNYFVSNINKVVKKEIYANHIGMISKQRDSILTRHMPDGSVLILNGTEYHLTLNAYQQ